MVVFPSVSVAFAYVVVVPKDDDGKVSEQDVFVTVPVATGHVVVVAPMANVTLVVDTASNPDGMDSCNQAVTMASAS